MTMLKGLLNLFLQNTCPLCQRNTPNLFCPYCNQQLQKSCLHDPNCSWQPPIPLFAWGSYGGILKRAIMMMKYENRPEIALFLGQLLGGSWLLNSSCKYQAPVIVPIPLHPDKMKIRGFNQSELIARGFCDVTGLRLKPHGLMRIKHTQPQFGISADNRQNNLMGAFDLGKDFFNRYPNKPILLIDDIYTTGATANSAIHSLDAYGINVIGLATVAKAIKNDPQNI